MLREKMSAMTLELGEAKHAAERAKDDLQQERTERDHRIERRIEELQRALKRADTERKGRILAEARLPVDLQDMQDGFETVKRLASAPGLIVPGHDPLVRRYFPEDLAPFVHRLDVGPDGFELS